MAIPSSRSFFGIAKETRPAAGAAPTAVAATDYIPFTSFTTKDVITRLEDKGMRGSMAELFDLIDGNKYSEIEFGIDGLADAIGYPIGGVLGDIGFTVGPPNIFTMAALNSQATNGQPTTWTISDYYGLGAASTRQYAGCQFESVDIKFTADAAVTATAKAKGYASATATNPTPTFSTVPVMPAWQGVVTLNGSTNTQLFEGNCLIQRSVSPLFTVDGNQRPYQNFARAVTVSGSLNLIFETDTELSLYLNNTKAALDIDFNQGAGATATEIKLHMTTVGFKSGNIDRSKDYLMLPLSYVAIANTTDVGASAGYSPIKVTLKNAKATGTYG
jgi:hypothetical protein